MLAVKLVVPGVVVALEVTERIVQVPLNMPPPFVVPVTVATSPTRPEKPWATMVATPLLEDVAITGAVSPVQSPFPAVPTPLRAMVSSNCESKGSACLVFFRSLHHYWKTLL